MSRRRSAGLAAALVGTVAAGVAAGIAVEKLAVGRTRLRPDPEAEEPFGRLPSVARRVALSDGVGLHVEEAGEGAVTVVLVHGFANTNLIWHYQRRELTAGALADRVRVLAYDHRAHGRSDPGDPAQHTIDQLGTDLAELLDACVPHGPVVLVGHSMGGMTVMALAEQRPELFGERVAGVVLIGTSAGGLLEVGPPVAVRAMRAVGHRTMPLVQRLAVRGAPVIEHGRRIGSDLAYLLTRFGGFGPDASPTHVELVERMIASTPVQVLSSFSATFPRHEKRTVLQALAQVPVLVVVGSYDRVTPPRHARELAAIVPSAELLVVDGAGHMPMLEKSRPVNLALRAFLRRLPALSERATGAP